MNVSSIIVTRGDVDLAPIIGQDWPDSVDEIVVWDNSEDEDLAVFGRYAAIEKAKNLLIFVQDDDVLLPRESIETIIKSWEQTTSWDEKAVERVYSSVVCNMPVRFRDQPQYERGDQALVGFGACFHRDAPGRAFNKWAGEMLTWGDYPGDWGEDFFRRTCDIVFTGLTPRVLVDVPYENLPWAEAENRMWKQPQHVAERMRMLELVRKVRDGNEG